MAEAKKNDVVIVRMTSDTVAEAKKNAPRGKLSKYVRDAVVEKLQRDRRKKGRR